MLKQKTERNILNNAQNSNQEFDLMKFKEAMKKEMEGNKYKR